MKKPETEPDLILGYQDNICFWFNERIQGNGTTLFKFNPETWKFNLHGKWASYSETSWFRRNEEKIKNAYATWLLEKELVNKE